MGSTMDRRAALRLLLAGGAAGLAGPTSAGLYGFLYERHKLTITNIDLPISDLPAALSGVRIGFLTDIHRSRWVSHGDVADAVAGLMAGRPDLIVLGGDYVTWGDRQYVRASAEGLESLAAPHGVFAILGNHDDDHDMPAALTARGFQVLKDARTTIRVRGETVDLVGIRFWTKRASKIASLVRRATGTVILLAHDPRRLTEAAVLRIPLVLSGHTHGGQVVLPGVGAIAARKFPLVAGVGRRGRTTMFVSRGLGTVYVPLRVNCPPEVALLTLRQAGPPAA
jgi:hypothetical protein